jgi:hypothetical protein
MFRVVSITGKYRQFTIRELMFLLLFFAMGLGGLLSGGVLAAVVVGTAMVITTGSAIVAVIARDELRAQAIGFFIPVLAYGALIWYAGSEEIDNPYEGKLLTTQIARSVHSAIAKTEWVDMTTGSVVPNYDPATDPNRPSGGGMGGFAGGSGGNGFGGMIGANQTPSISEFMSLAHVLLATMFGYIGVYFAVFIYRREQRIDEQSDARKSPVGREFES